MGRRVSGRNMKTGSLPGLTMIQRGFVPVPSLHGVLYRQNGLDKWVSQERHDQCYAQGNKRPCASSVCFLDTIFSL